MVLFRDTRRFEIMVEEREGYWLAKLQGFVPGRLYPTVYLLREVTTREDAVTAVHQAWHRLFPEEAPLQWQEPALHLIVSGPRRQRRTEGSET